MPSKVDTVHNVNVQCDYVNIKFLLQILQVMASYQL